MGSYLRKALRLGPFRINLSQHGVGLSVGVTGARFGMDASGHPYVHAGRHGLYYRKRWPIPAAPSRDPLALLSGPPPAGTNVLWSRPARSVCLLAAAGVGEHWLAEPGTNAERSDSVRRCLHRAKGPSAWRSTQTAPSRCSKRSRRRESTPATESPRRSA